MKKNLLFVYDVGKLILLSASIAAGGKCNAIAITKLIVTPEINNY